ncbi:MAG: hypothetical protein ACTTJG_07145 [Treponema sp.]
MKEQGTRSENQKIRTDFYMEKSSYSAKNPWNSERKENKKILQDTKSSKTAII